jgi:hypothetical protein
MGVVEELLRSVLLNDLALVEEDAIGHFLGKAHLVGEDDHRHAGLGQFAHNFQHFLDHLRVEGTGGLIEAHDLWLHGQGTCDGHPLLSTR